MFYLIKRIQKALTFSYEVPLDKVLNHFQISLLSHRPPLSCLDQANQKILPQFLKARALISSEDYPLHFLNQFLFLTQQASKSHDSYHYWASPAVFLLSATFLQTVTYFPSQKYSRSNPNLLKKQPDCLDQLKLAFLTLRWRQDCF